MDNTTKIVERLIESDKKKILYLWVVKNNVTEATKIIDEYADGQEYDIEEIFEQFEIAYGKVPEIMRINQEERESRYKPKCPICQSTNLSKISSLSKAAKIAAFGVFGMGDNGKTWKCNQCGSKF